MVIYSYVIKEFTRHYYADIYCYSPIVWTVWELYLFYHGFGLMSGLPLGSCLDCTVGLSFHISTFVYGFVSMASVSAIAPIEVRRAIHNRP